MYVHCGAAPCCTCFIYNFWFAVIFLVCCVVFVPCCSRCLYCFIIFLPSASLFFSSDVNLANSLPLGGGRCKNQKHIYLKRYTKVIEEAR